MTQLRSVAEIAEVVVWIYISAAFRPLSCIHFVGKRNFKITKVRQNILDQNALFQY